MLVCIDVLCALQMAQFKNLKNLQNSVVSRV